MNTRKTVLILIKVGLTLATVLLALFLQEILKFSQQLTTLLGAFTIWGIWSYKSKKKENKIKKKNQYETI